MIEPYYDQDGITIYNADCREVLPHIDGGSVNLICTDPPYFKVKNEWWDRQWDKPDEFLNWIGDLCEAWQRVLAFNGSLYVFASPQMAWGVEGEVRQWFNVINRIAWLKETHTGLHMKTCKEALRSYFPNTELIIFAEQHGADGNAMNGAGYTAKCDELRGFVFEPLRAYLARERDAAGYTTRKVAEQYQKKTGSRTVTGMAWHWFERVQWALPTLDNYEWLRALFNSSGGDYLRREYEDLRRPFTATKERPYTDVWEYETVKAYKGKHPCEKPKQMMDHIVLTSSREGDTVLDCFGGSMRLAESCKEYDRKFVGIEVNEEYCEAAANRLAQGVLF